MKKVIHLLNTNVYSGAENVAITIINNMKNLYPEDFDFYYASPSGQIDEVLRKNDIKHIIYKKINIIVLRKIIKDVKPDIIHAHDFTTSVIASFFSSHAKVISHLHNNPLWLQQKCLKSYLYKLVTKKFKKILLVSKAIEDEYIYKNAICNKSIIIGNPIVLEKIKTLNSNRKIDVLFVGRMTKQKNPLRFIEICSQLKEGTIIKMIGDGDMFFDCEEYINKKQMLNIELLGFKTNVLDYMRDSKVLLMTSDWEGFGLVAIEAMSVGTPVIANNVGGLSSIVNNKSGLLYTKPEQAITEISKLLLDHKYWNSKSEQAIKRAQKLENIDEYCQKLKLLYEEN